MHQTFFVFVFKLNQDNITENYCVNKDVKNSCCKGSCYLKKVLDKEENKSDKSSSNEETKQKEILVCMKMVEYVFESINFSDFTIQNFNTHYLSKIKSGFLPSIVHPPNVLV